MGSIPLKLLILLCAAKVKRRSGFVSENSIWFDVSYANPKEFRASVSVFGEKDVYLYASLNDSFLIVADSQ